MISNSLIATARGRAQAIPSPGRHLLWAALLLLLTLLVQFVCDTGLAATVGFHNASLVPGGGAVWQVSAWQALAVSVGSAQAALLAAACWRAGRIGAGGRWAGLGLGPIRRPLLLAALAVLAAVIAPLWVILLQSALAVPIPATTHLLLSRDSVTARIVMVGLVTVGAAVSEDLFFRGWLWQALRQRWQELPVAIVTTGLWLLLHLGEGWSRPLFLIPLGVLLALARQRCGGVAASMALHLLNNSAVIGLLVAASG